MDLLVPSDYAQAFRIEQPADWTLYHLPTREGSDSFLWQRFKLMRPPGTARQEGQARVFMLTWNPEECRLAAGREAARLEREQPELYARVGLILMLTFDEEWLTARYDRGEIDAERERLKAIKAQARAGRRAARQAL